VHPIYRKPKMVAMTTSLSIAGPQSGIIPWAHPSLQPKRHLNRFNRFLQGSLKSDRQTDKPVGFCAPSSERPQFGMPRSFDRCTPPHHRFNQNIPPSVVLLQQCHCRNRHRGKLQSLSPPSVLFESSRIFLQYMGDRDAKNDGLEF